MYVYHSTEDRTIYPNLIIDELPVSESPLFSPVNSLNFLRPGQDEVLKFVKTELPVSAAQYACWHRIVLEQLICKKTSNGTKSVDFELASTCFREIERVHSFSEGRCL
jgi:hypothetical protein